MRKNFLSAILVLLLMLSLTVCAHADVTFYPAPGDIDAGTELNHLIASLSAGSSITAEGNLPEGISLVTESQDSLLNVYFRGTALKAGTYNCVLKVNGENALVCTLHIRPAVPELSISPDTVCSPGEKIKLSVTARAIDGSELSYQWYKADSRDKAEAALLIDAVSADYEPDTSAPGTFYYYCTVTALNNGESRSADTDFITVTTEGKGPAGISVSALPAKTVYRPGETLDTAGLQISVSYADGSSKLISEGFSVSPTVLEGVGSHTIEVSYQGQTCSFTVKTEDEQEIIEGIGVLTLPSKVLYSPGELLDTQGLSIRVYTSKGYRDVSQGLSCSPETLDTPGTQTITVSYGDKTCTFSVKVQAEVKPASLSILTKPDKLSYKPGEALDTTGLTLRLVMSSNETQEITQGFICSPDILEKEGRQEIEVIYKGLSCRFSVTVSAGADKAEDKNDKEKPLPSQAPQDTSDEEPAGKPEKAGNGGRIFIMAVMIIAIIALAALGVTAFIMNRNGGDDFADKFYEFIDKFRKK